ncbi:MAG: STAS domain-containing protein [Prolixibacteraceae bacterium]
MELKTERIGKYMVITASGRLDASWADYFADAFLNYIRNGDHHLVVDAAAMDFLSSAGIRSLIRVNKELNLVKGSFTIVNASPFVLKTLEATGFGIWLSASLPDDMQSADQVDIAGKNFVTDLFQLNPQGNLKLSLVNAWKSWNAVAGSETGIISFPQNIFALGIGSSAVRLEEATGQFGEFIAVCGNLAYQSPEEKIRPDYLLSVSEFIPEMRVIQALSCEGEMAYLFRFSPQGDQLKITISELVEHALAVSGSRAAAFVIMAETGGLVGANLIRSPGKIESKPISNSMEVRDWLSFCGERVFAGEQTLVFGIVAKESESVDCTLLKQLPSNPALAARIHAVVFPYQPLPNGLIDLKTQVDKFFSGPPPVALLRLVDDNRPVQGLGESTFIRGACWCAPVQNSEGLV